MLICRIWSDRYSLYFLSLFLHNAFGIQFFFISKSLPQCWDVIEELTRNDIAAPSKSLFEGVHPLTLPF